MTSNSEEDYVLWLFIIDVSLFLTLALSLLKSLPAIFIFTHIMNMSLPSLVPSDLSTGHLQVLPFLRGGFTLYGARPLKMIFRTNAHGRLFGLKVIRPKLENQITAHRRSIICAILVIHDLQQKPIKKYDEPSLFMNHKIMTRWKSILYGRNRAFKMIEDELTTISV